MLIDGLQCGHFDRSVLEQLRKADVGCVTITLGFWETARHAELGAARAEAYGRAVEALGEFLARAPANDLWVGVARTRLALAPGGGPEPFALGFSTAHSCCTPSTSNSGSVGTGSRA